ncbi:ADP-ribosylglycohydrolase family protein [Arthrobacter sp. C152]
MSTEPGVPAPTLKSRIHGCLLGGALGDAAGYAVQRELDGPGRFTDDTQLTLYTVDGLVEALEWANAGVGADVNACLWLAYLRWLAGQGGDAGPSAPVPQPRWIDGNEVLRERRDPEPDCISGLATGEMGTAARPVNPTSKGRGTVMRSAPFGLVPHIAPDAVYKLSADAAALTHGHPSARQSAGIFSLLIHRLVSGEDVRAAAAAVTAHAAALPDASPELPQRLEAALRLADTAGAGAEGLVEALGGGEAAEEALAVALYSVLATLPRDGGEAEPSRHFSDAVALAVGHGGGQDTAGALAGNILGARYGEDCLPGQWLQALEGADVVRGMADQLVGVTSAEG